MKKNNSGEIASLVTRHDRQKMKQHGSAVIWLTGLSASGKSTIAVNLEKQLHRRHIHTFILDGDAVRTGLNKDLGFTLTDRKENIRRIGEVAKLFTDAGIVVIAAFISPYREDRQNARKLMASGEFVEVYVKCPLQVCESRDPKGLYAKARQGLLKNFTGIDDPYEESLSSEVVVETDQLDIDASVSRVINYLETKGIISQD